MPLPPDVDISDGLQTSHDATVSVVSARLQDLYSRRQPYRVYHGSTNSTRASNKSAQNIVDTSSLNHVLAITRPEPDSGQSASILVEPNVSMGALVDATLPHGLVPPVVMEFDGITAGGGFAGTSAESTSFREGVFDRTVTWVEMVLPNGEVVTATSDPHDPRRDLFEGAASSFGTLGVVTALRIRLRPAEDFVYCRHVPVSSADAACAVIKEHKYDANVDFIDGIMYSEERGVVVLGSLTSSDDLPSGIHFQRFTRAHDPWFYLHIESLLFPRPWFPSLVTTSNALPNEVEEAVPLRDYLFRYDRGGFWVGKVAFTYFVTPFNRVTRTLLDPFMRTSTMFHALHKSGLADSHLLQDIAVPISGAPKLMKYIDQKWGGYPIWLCPLDTAGPPPLFNRSMTEQQQRGTMEDLLLNFGAWGYGPTDRKAFIELNRGIEHEVLRLGGQKCLYAHAYYTQDEFWQVYNKEKYDALRQKYHADWLPTVFDKMKVDLSILHQSDEQIRNNEKNLPWGRWLHRKFWDIWPMRGVYGVVHCAIQRDYLIAKERKWLQLLLGQDGDQHAKTE